MSACLSEEEEGESGCVREEDELTVDIKLPSVLSKIEWFESPASISSAATSETKNLRVCKVGFPFESFRVG